MRVAGIALSMIAVVGCRGLDPAREPPQGSLVGTWGGDDAGLIVTDSSAHVHIGCTLGDVGETLVPDSAGRFEATGRYNVEAFPVNRGIEHPARFTGRVTGTTLSLTVTLTDTVLTLGPVRLTYGREPGMRACPICRAPGPVLAVRRVVPATPAGRRPLIESRRPGHYH